MARRNLPLGGAIPLEPGERDQPVRIERLVEAVGTSGFPVETWRALAAPIWMARRLLKAHERFAAGQPSAPVETQWEMGYRADMDPTQVDVAKTRRLVYQGRIHDIVGADVIGRREGIELLTVTGGQRA
jgi:head-tail adaptor